MNGNGDPGFVELVRSRVMAPLERAHAERQMSRAHAAQAEAILSRFEEVARRVQPEDDGFVLVGGDELRELSEQDSETLRQRARKADLRSPTVVGYRKSLLSYVMGKSLTLSADTGDEQLDARLDDWWAQFKRVNGWGTMEEEIPHRTWRDGEVFLRSFVQEVEGPIEGWEPSREVQARIGRDLALFEPPEVPAGMVHLRFIPPEEINDPRGDVSHGVITSANDVQTVLGYVHSPDGQQVEFLPADEVRHIKIGADSDVKRGRSLYEPLLKRNKQYEDWLDYRLMLNLARAAVVLIKRISGTAAQVQSVRDGEAPSRDTANTRRQRMFKPGTTVQVNDAIEYDFLSPNLDAADAKEDGRNILLNMAAATNLPEFMFTADANAMNFATALAAEAPAMREFESWQEFFEPEYVGIWRDVMVEAARFQQLGSLGPEEVRQMEPHVSWEPVQVRDELEHAQAQQIRFGAGILSKRTWQEEAGLDPETEQERISQERAEGFEFTPPPGD